MSVLQQACLLWILIASYLGQQREQLVKRQAAEANPNWHEQSTNMQILNKNPNPPEDDHR